MSDPTQDWLWMVAGTRVFGSPRERPDRAEPGRPEAGGDSIPEPCVAKPRSSRVGLVAILINLVVWHIGLAILLAGGFVRPNVAVAHVCRGALAIGLLLVPVTVIEYCVERLAIPGGRGRLASPFLAITTVLVMYGEISCIK